MLVVEKGNTKKDREKKKRLFKLKLSHLYSSITGISFTINGHKLTRLQYSATQTCIAFTGARTK